MDGDKKKISIFLANPRGFCAGVERAIKIVERSLEVFNAPVYVLHEIVHNKYVVKDLQSRGAIFVESLESIPKEYPVIISAHGTSQMVMDDVKGRNVIYVDATCPLVTKVHMEVKNHYRKGRKILMIGHKGHVEVAGTMGQVPDGVVTLIETVEDARKIHLDEYQSGIAYVTQTTLSIDDTSEIIQVLKERFPDIVESKTDDICYATSNRQQAVKEIASSVDILYVIGSPNSSNSNRLVEVGKQYGCDKVFLIDSELDIDMSMVDDDDVSDIGITAGASAPEILVQKVLDVFKAKYHTLFFDISSHVKEEMSFSLPTLLR